MTSTGLILYGTKGASSVLSSAGKFCSNGLGGSTTTSNTQCGTNIKYGELYGKGNASYTWPQLDSIPAPTGNGFLYDTSLNGKTTLAGPWSAIFAATVNTGTATGCTLTVRFYAYNSNTTSYTSLSSTTSSSFTLNTTATNFNAGEIVIASRDWTQYEYLYVDAWLWIGTNNTGSSTAVVRIGTVTAVSTSGWENYAQIAMPGYITTGSSSVFGPFKNDTFWRADQSGIGTASDGNSWTLAVGTAGNQAQNIVTDRVHNTCTTGNTVYLSTLGDADPNNYVEAICQVQANSTNAYRYGPVVRFVDGAHYLSCNIMSGTMLSLYQGGSVSGAFSYSANTPVTIRFRVYGQKVMGKAWLSTNAEPAAWTFTATDTTHMCMGKSGLLYRPSSTTTDAADFWTLSSYDVTQALNAGGRFNLGVAPTTPYPVLVKSLSPTVYYRLCDNTYECKDEMGAYNAKPTGLTGATPLKYLQNGPCTGLDSASYSILLTATNSDNYIDVNAGFTTTNWATLTVECWFKLTTSTFAANMRLVNNSHTDSDNNGFQLFVSANAANVRFAVGNGTSNAYGQYTPPAALPYGVWHHAVGVYDGSHVYVYVDGVQGATVGNLTGNVHAGSGAQMTMGRGVPYNSDYFGGNLAEVAVYPSALTATQVKTNFVTGSWYSSGYEYRREITIQGSQVSGTTDLSSFPALISLSGTTLKTRENGGHLYNADGYDVLFFDSTSNVWYPHEIETYDGSAGTMLAHVNIATLYANSNNTVIVVYYGNSAISTSQNSPSTWNSDYQAVWHLGDGSTISATDSTSHSVTLDVSSGTPTAATGQVNGGVQFTGASSQYYATSVNAAITGTTGRTLSFWSKNSNTSHSGLVCFGSNSAGGEFAAIINNNKWTIWGYGSGHDIDTAKTPPTGAWHYEVITRDSSGNYVWYEDGVSIYSVQNTTNSTVAGPYMLGAMNDTGTYYYYTGVLDEVRVVSAVHTADWIKTEYTNQNTPTNFISVGSEHNSPTLGVGTTLYAQGRFASNIAQTHATSGRFKLQDVGTVKYQIGNSPHATGHGTQTHIFYAENTARWWAFFFYDTGSIYTASSTDGRIWEAGPGASLAHNSGLEGRNLSVSYKNISSHDVVHISLSYMQTNAYTTVWRAELVDKNTITFGTETQIDTMWTGAIGTTYDGNTVVFDSTNKTHVMAGYDNTDPCNVGSWEFPNADTGTAWTIGSPTNHSLYTAAHQVASRFSAADAYSSGYVFTVQDNGNASPGWTNLKSCIWNTSAWQTVYDVYSSPLGSNADPNDWGCCMLDSTHALIVRRNRTPELDYTKCTITSGTSESWSSPATMPTGYTVPASGAGIAMIPDGSGGAYCCIIDGGSEKYIKYIHYDGSSWGGDWTTLVSSSATRNNISATPAFHGTTAVLAWTDGSGSNYDIKSMPFSVSLSQTQYTQGRFSVLASATRYSTGRYLMRVASPLLAAGRAQVKVAQTRLASAIFREQVLQDARDGMGRLRSRVGKTLLGTGRFLERVGQTFFAAGRVRVLAPSLLLSTGRLRSRVAATRLGSGRLPARASTTPGVAGRFLGGIPTSGKDGAGRIRAAAVASGTLAAGRSHVAARQTQMGSGRAVTRATGGGSPVGRIAVGIRALFFAASGRMRVSSERRYDGSARFSLGASAKRAGMARFTSSAGQTQTGAGRLLGAVAPPLRSAAGRLAAGLSGLRATSGRFRVLARGTPLVAGRFLLQLQNQVTRMASGRFQAMASATPGVTGVMKTAIATLRLASGRALIGAAPLTRTAQGRYALGLAALTRSAAARVNVLASGLAAGAGRFLLQLQNAATHLFAGRVRVAAHLLRDGQGRALVGAARCVLSAGLVSIQALGARTLTGAGRVRVSVLAEGSHASGRWKLFLSGQLFLSGAGRVLVAARAVWAGAGRLALRAESSRAGAGLTRVRVGRTQEATSRVAVGARPLEALSGAGLFTALAQATHGWGGRVWVVVYHGKTRTAAGLFKVRRGYPPGIVWRSARGTMRLTGTRGTMPLRGAAGTMPLHPAHLSGGGGEGRTADE